MNKNSYITFSAFSKLRNEISAQYTVAVYYKMPAKDVPAGTLSGSLKMHVHTSPGNAPFRGNVFLLLSVLLVSFFCNPPDLCKYPYCYMCVCAPRLACPTVFNLFLFMCHVCGDLRLQLHYVNSNCTFLKLSKCQYSILTSQPFGMKYFVLIENHVITSVQVKVKSFRPDTSGLLQLSAVSVSSRAPCVV